MTQPDDLGLDLETLSQQLADMNLPTEKAAAALEALGAPVVSSGDGELQQAMTESDKGLDLPTPEQQAQAVLDRFLDWATDPRLAVLDTETTGLGAGDQVIEIAMVDAYGRTLIDQRVRPTFPVPADSTAIHGITDDDLNDCPTFDQIWPQLKELLWNYNVCIYNASYDLARIGDSLDATMPGWYMAPEGVGHSEPFKAWTALCRRIQDRCVMEAYAPVGGNWHPYWGNYSWVRLADACEARGVDTSDLKAHAALDDARATLRLIQGAAQLTPADLPWIGHEDEQ